MIIKKTGKISANFKRLIFSEELPIEARLLNTIYLVGIFGALLSVIIRILSKNNIVIILITSLIALFVLVTMFISAHHKKYTLYKWVLLTIICDVFFPVVFFPLGGVNSAMPGYYILTIVLIFFLAWGKSRLIFLIIHIAVIILSYYLSSLPFFARFLPEDHEVNNYVEHINTIVIVGLCIGFMISFQNHIYMAEKKKADSAEKDLVLRNKLLEVVKETSEILLKTGTSDLEKSLHGAMDLMARCLDADRMYLWKNRLIDGKIRYEQQYEWLGGFAAEKTLKALTGKNYIDTIPRWDYYFSAGRIVNGPLPSLSHDEQSVLARFGVRSILTIPVFLEDKYWGFISFDDCRQERTFSQDEVSILRSGGLLLANAIVRHHNSVMIETRMRQQELMAHISKSFVSGEPMDHHINRTLERIGEFLGTSRIVILTAEKDAENIRPAHTWVCSDEWQPAYSRPEFNKMINIDVPRSIPASGFLTAICCNDVIGEYKGKYRALAGEGTKSFIWAPVYVEGALWGLISAEECIHTRLWSESDIQLMGALSSSIAGDVARKMIDKARTAALNQAVHASRAKGNFLANMSHEMRTPMNAIIGMTSIGRHSSDIRKKDYAFEKIENASSHLLGVINDILDMSKIEADKFELSLVDYDFEKMLQKVVNVINFRVEERRQEFSVFIDEHIPNYLEGDDQRLAQVITNLLSNAIKFTPEKGSIQLNTKLLGEEDGLCSILIEVSDTGIGISEEQQKKLFSSFQQADSGTSRKFGGTGLGLAISKRIVELMGGEIWINSEKGKGSTFSFTFKAKKGSGPDSGPPKASLKNLRVLIVDDSPEILEYFCDIMTRFGIACDTASSGEEALAAIDRKGGYDLYFIDYRMPGMDGLELTRKITEQASAEPMIVLISSADWTSLEKEAREAGIKKFLPKPLFPSAITDIISECAGTEKITEPKTEAPEEMTGSFEGYVILLAEDVDINREIVITLLEPTGLKIETAENGKEALEKFAACPEKYNMVFMDVQMPEMDGYEATRQIRGMKNEWAEKIPIVAMTANVFREDIEKCIAAGMNDHVGKPLDLKEVIEKLKTFLLYR